MKVYIECYRLNGQQILGTLDGQAVIRCKNFRRSAAYKQIHRLVNGDKKLSLNGRVKMVRIVDEHYHVIEEIRGTEYQAYIKQLDEELKDK